MMSEAEYDAIIDYRIISAAIISISSIEYTEHDGRAGNVYHSIFSIPTGNYFSHWY